MSEESIAMTMHTRATSNIFRKLQHCDGQSTHSLLNIIACPGRYPWCVDGTTQGGFCVDFIHILCHVEQYASLNDERMVVDHVPVRLALNSANT